MASETFWDSYQELVKKLLPPLKASDGFSEAEIAQAEKKLGFTPPLLLREFYMRVGKRQDINNSHDRLLTPPEHSGNMLVFYEENQGVCYWAINLSDPDQEDPKVYRGADPASGRWEEDFPHLSEFLIAMLFFQCVSGGMRYSGIGHASTAKIQNLGAEWETVTVGGAWNNRVYLRDGQLIFVLGSDPNPEIHAGARTKLKFLDIGLRFGVKWGYRTMDDE